MSMTDIFKAATGEPDHKAIFDWLSPSLEPAAGSMSVPAWGGPDSAPSPMAQDFNHADRSVGTDTLTVNAVVANVANIAGRVNIDSAGIVVKQPASLGGTVIIDGTSNMFKILASGGVTSTCPVMGTQEIGYSSASVTLTSLGALGAIPMHLSSVATALSNASQRFVGRALVYHYDADWGSFYNGGPTGYPNLPLFESGTISTHLDGSSQCVVQLECSNADSVPWTFYGFFYILKEAAL